jgi:hypothetical protein
MRLLGHIKALTLRAGRQEPCDACVEELARLQLRRHVERGAHYSTWEDEDGHLQGMLKAEALVAMTFMGGCRCPAQFDAPELMTLSLAFAPDFRSVAMLRKKRPDWQAGLLNGLGGKRTLEDGGKREEATDANVRKFFEESGLSVDKSRWKYAGRMSDAAIRVWEVQVFTAVLTGDELQALREMPDARGASEQVLVPDTEYALSGEGSIGNIPWLVAFCRDLHRDPPDPRHAPPQSFDVRY